ncbi:Insecticidal toxin complex protein [Yersinia mollaretii ATCC 43969]|uniref:Insecticidal toxin complex protein n=2 Tax=Yersinia mollaretii TaxID=33060 RepID=A0ABP2EG74_YERMW|nr:Insecticidal toxin complex protein [Yersinia mollaretii ATCC 43969]
MLPTDLCEQTPAIAISDNRGLAIRALAYNRIHSRDVPDQLITRNRYNALGQLVASRDPRLEIDNFRYHHTLSGAALHTDGVDNGTSVQLADIEGRPLLSMDAKQTRHWVAYEPALGRPLEHQQQTQGGLKTITDRFFYGENSKLDKASNLNGQCIRHYDTAGLHQVISLSITATPLQQQFRLLTDTLGPVDWFGEEQSWASRLSGESFVTRSTTDALGQLITQTDAKGHTQRMAYNRAGQLFSSWLTLNGGREQEIVRSLTYSAAGQKLREEGGNGVVTEYRYEAETQRLIGIKTTRPAQSERPTLLQDLRYDYDPVGNILAIHNDAEATRFYRNQKIVPETTYRYDALYQLIEATGRESDSNSAQSANLPALSLLTDSNQYVNYTRRYTYDRAGNLLKIQHVGASQYSTHITLSDSSNHGIQQQDGLTAADIRSQFDAAGNQQQLQPGQPLQWDARHQLQQVTTVKRGAENSASDDYESYLYGSDGMRVVKQSIQHTNNTVQTAKVTYLPGLELRTRHQGAELTEDFQVITLGAAGRAQVRVLLWQQGKPEGIDNNQLRYSFDNQIGSSLLELDTHGDIISQEEYYPFGGTAVFAARHTLEAKYKTIRYSGKERDATGLYYYGFRYYMPWLGRWLSADPAGTVDGLNLYRMVRNNPVGLMDEDGLSPGVKYNFISKGYDTLADIGKRQNIKHFTQAKRIVTNSYLDANSIIKSAIEKLNDNSLETTQVLESFFGVLSPSENSRLLISLNEIFNNISESILELKYVGGKAVRFFENTGDRKSVAAVTRAAGQKTAQANIFISADIFLTLNAIKRSHTIIHETSHLNGSEDYFYTHKISNNESYSITSTDLLNLEHHSKKLYATNIKQNYKENLKETLSKNRIENKDGFISITGTSDLDSAMVKFKTSDRKRVDVISHNADSLADLSFILGKKYLLSKKK